MSGPRPSPRRPVSDDRDVIALFSRWVWWRAVLHNGWWLVASVYLVVDADLSPAQLVLIGGAQSLVALAFEVPAGVLADTVSRKWSLVVSHALMGSAMIVTGLVTDFAALVTTQMLWGLAWTFASGADVAWMTDELEEPARSSVVLVRAGRAQLTGAAAGIVAIGTLGALTERSTAMVLAGAAMLALGLYVAVRFRERRFVATPVRRWATSRSLLVRGAALVRGSRSLLVVLAATLLVNGAGDAFGRLRPRRLVDLGLPTDPVAWLTALGLLTLLAGAAVLRVVGSHIDRAGTARRGYLVACAVAVLGSLVFAAAPEEVSGSAAVLVVAGIALPVTRTLATIWVNRETGSEVRATVHSFLAQAEYLGEVLGGLAIALVARLAGVSAALTACAALFAIAVVLIRRAGASGTAGAGRAVAAAAAHGGSTSS